MYENTEARTGCAGFDFCEPTTREVGLADLFECQTGALTEESEMSTKLFELT